MIIFIWLTIADIHSFANGNIIKKIFEGTSVLTVSPGKFQSLVQNRNGVAKINVFQKMKINLLYICNICRKAAGQENRLFRLKSFLIIPDCIPGYKQSVKLT